MKTTNMNNTNTSIEATTSEMAYIATRVTTEKFEERTEIRILAFECIDIDTIIGNFVHKVRCNYVTKNLLTGEEYSYNNDSFSAWCKTKTLAEIANYRIIRTRESGEGCYPEKCEESEELHFTNVKRSEIAEVEHPLWLLEVYNADTNEMVACNWYETPGALLNWADERVIDWRYTETGVVNHMFYANGIDITKRFYARDRKRYILSVSERNCNGINITIDTYQYPSLAKSGKRKFICSICGKEHLVEEGTFLPHPVRPNKDSNGRYNHCCAACYEKYVGPMHACRWEIGTLWTKIKELDFWRHTWNTEEMFYNLTIAEMDSIIKQGNLREKAMYLLIHYEPNDAEKEGRRLRDKSQMRRWKAQKAAKLAKQ